MSLETLDYGDEVRIRIGREVHPGTVVSPCDASGLIQVKCDLAQRIDKNWTSLLFHARGARIGDAIIGVYTVHCMDELPETLEKPWEEIEREEKEYRELLDEWENRLIAAQNSRWNGRRINQSSDPF